MYIKVSSDIECFYKSGRFLYWTEDNRLYSVVDDNYLSYYTYDDSGERRLKLTGSSIVDDRNAALFYYASILEDATLYPSPYIVMDKKGYTKHYYAGSDRICAKIGGGGFDRVHPILEYDTIEGRVSYQLLEECLNATKKRLLNDNSVECISNDGSWVEELNLDIVGIPKMAQIGASIHLSDIYRMAQELERKSKDEDEVYYYHSDHLGSASWITDAHGDAIQHLRYLPFGQPQQDERTSGYNERYTFSGKERDIETGLSYFGARYYDADLLTGWLSVDPMADKYPSISPYNYCAWNPIKLVDPDGREDWEVDKLGHITKCQRQPENPAEDRIRVKGTSEWNEKNSISGLTRGTINEQQRVDLSDASTEYGSLILLGGTQEDRINVFKFCANHADVEFSLMEFDLGSGQKHRSLLTTSHDRRAVGKDKIGDALGSAIAGNDQFALTLELHLHNHFGTGEYGWGASSADYSFKQGIINKQNEFKKGLSTDEANRYPSAKFGIYKCRGNDKQIKYY